MKPSERIDEIGIYNILNNGSYSEGRFDAYKAVMAIIQYLDEEYEKKQHPKHKRKDCIFSNKCENCL